MATAPSVKSNPRVRTTRRPRIVHRLRAAAPDFAREYAPLAGFLTITAATALLGARFNPTTDNPATKLWYSGLRKARFNPPPPVFAPVWTALYTAIAIAGWRVYRAPTSRARSEALAWWTAQMALNAAWTPLFFGTRSPRAALVDQMAMLTAIGAFINSARKVDRTAAAVMLPYLSWVAFAGYLNAEVVRKNR